MVKRKINWRLLLGEGLFCLIFSVMLSTAGSLVTYLMLASLSEQNQSALFDLTYLEAAPRLAALVYCFFFISAMLGLTRFRVHGQVTTRPRLHWMLAFIIYGVVGLLPGLLFWLLFWAADRPGAWSFLS